MIRYLAIGGLALIGGIGVIALILGYDLGRLHALKDLGAELLMAYGAVTALIAAGVIVAILFVRN